MGNATKISYVHHSWSGWRGCTHAVLPDGTPHAGCLNCFAERGAKRNPAVMGRWGDDGTRVLASEAYWQQPIVWNREAEKAGERRRVLWDLGDPFEDWRDEMAWPDGRAVRKGTRGTLVPIYLHREAFSDADEWSMDDTRRRAFQLIDATPWLDWLLLTKRPWNIDGMLPCKYGHDQCSSLSCPYRRRENLWLGMSCSDQASADALIPELLKCRDLSPILWVSLEPQVGPVSDGNGWRWGDLDWVVQGGESGPNARPFDIAWARSVRDQCKAAGVRYYFKQAGSQPVESDGTNLPMHLMFRDRKGGDSSEWPNNLRVRQFPESKGA